jgi:hypothetical protein
MSVNDKRKRICWICGTEVDLETCKVDEHGLPVHEACQTLKLSMQDGGVSRRSRSETLRLWERPKVS